MINGFIFDLDGTLIDSADCAVHATQRAFMENGLPPVSADMIKRSMGIPIERSFLEFAGEAGREVDWSTVFRDFRVIYGELSTTMLRPFDGVSALLEAIHKSQRPIAVVTSKKTSVAIANCRDCQLDFFIDHFIGSDIVEHYKPHPDGVLKAVAMCKASERLSDFLVIGDAPVDIAMGKNAGTMTCAALWGTHSRQDLLASDPSFAVEEPQDILDL